MDFIRTNLNFKHQPILFTNTLFMKQKLFGAASVVAFILFGASCSNQEQSEFNMDSVKQEVTVSAKVTYDAGVEVDASNPNGYKIVNAKPAVNRKVFVEIPYAQYSGTATGNKIFETVTDENGVFTITVPTKSTGVTGSIRLEEFTAIYQEYVKMGDDGKPVFKSKLYSYDTPAGLNNINLKPGAFKFPDNNDISYVKHALDNQDFDESVTIAGSINLAYETGFRKGAFKNASNANVEFEIAYVGMVNPLKFGTTTDANGNYKIVLPMRSLSEGFTINSIKVLGIGDNQFKHWVSDTIAQPEIIKGAYELAGITAGAPIAFADVIDGITYDLGTKNLIFTPYYNAGITNMPQPDNWSDDLIGWAAGRGDLGFDESFSKTTKLTGKIYMPYLKSFGEGAYRNERQTIILTSATAPYNKGLTVITEEDGSFSVDLPVKDENAINFSVKLEKMDQPFTFIGSKNTVVLYDGKYGPAAANIVNIKAEGTEWYELGDYYFKYVPAATNTPDEWNANLIGWYKDKTFNKINPDKKVTGKILFAVEESYGKGTYEAKPFLVSVRATQAGVAARTFAVKPAADGTISFDLPLKDELDQPNLSISNTNFPTNEFAHYPEYGKDDIKLLADPNPTENLIGYTHYKTVYSVKDHEWNDLGTRYYKFAQTTDEDDLPSTFHKNLIGWLIMSDANDIQYQQTANASGVAKQAVETDFLKGEYVSAKGQIVKVTIGGTEAEVLTDKNGNFSFKVPLKYVGEEPALGVSADPVTVDKFTHYDLDGKTIILEGKYTGNKVKEDDAAWNDLGTIYYVFTPKDNAEKNKVWDGWDTYTKKIAGWVYKKGYKYTKAVSGNVLMAKETAFRKGEYEAKAGIPVLITAGEDYATATDANGYFSIDVLLQFADDEYDVAWDKTAAYMKKLGAKFEHYRKPGAETSTIKVEGGYTEKDTKKPSGAKWYELGTRYYIFTPNAAPINWTTALCGWEVWEPDQKLALTIEGYIKKAKEVWKTSTSQAEASWTSANYATADITVGTIGTYKVSTDGKGKFTVQVKVKDQPDDLTITVKADQFSDSFEHWEDPAVNTKTVIKGDFKNVAASNTKLVNKGSGTVPATKFVYEPSAKMEFTPTDPASPTGWTASDWWSIRDNEE